MRGACGPHKRIDSNTNPYSEKWYNCKHDDEPEPLKSKQAIDDFKQLCPSMYTHDNQPLCCRDDQLAILKYDLMKAYALIGSCTSCYFNFRQIWCQFVCNANQSEFIVPLTVKKIDPGNFTQLLGKYNNHKKKMESSDYEYEDYEDEDYEYVDEYETSNKKDSKKNSKNVANHAKHNHKIHHNNKTADILKTTTTKSVEGENYDYNESYDHESYDDDEMKRLKREALITKQVEIVDAAITFVDKKFMDELVESCR